MKKARSLNEDLTQICKLAGLTESEISAEELSDEQKNIAEQIVKALPHKKLSLLAMYSTIHGEIVQFKIGQDAYANPRYGSEDLRALASISGIRWIEFDKTRILVGL